jgi:hypothetical protein
MYNRCAPNTDNLREYFLLHMAILIPLFNSNKSQEIDRSSLVSRMCPQQTPFERYKYSPTSNMYRYGPEIILTAEKHLHRDPMEGYGRRT